MKYNESDLLTPRALFAPAKINLYLHVTGRMANGYHDLDSLVTFADIGDNLEITPGEELSLTINGPFSEALKNERQNEDPQSENLAIKAAMRMIDVFDIRSGFRILLTKNLPLSSGIGGGSADAAAVIRGLGRWAAISPTDARLGPLCMNLGADVRICIASAPARIRGIGDETFSVPRLPKTFAVLVNPLLSCPTAEVFKRYNQKNNAPIDIPAQFFGFDSFIDFLKHQVNDLETAAISIVPQIAQVLEAINSQKNCALARMSGSGSTCFGLFETRTAADQAAACLQQENRGWWIQSTQLHVSTQPW